MHLFVLKTRHKKFNCPVFAFRILKRTMALLQVRVRPKLSKKNSREFSKPPPMKKCKKRSDPAVDEACSLLRTIKHNLETSDHFTKFGEYVANRVRDLSNSRLQSILEHKINTILFNAEMEVHNVQMPVRVHLDSEPFPTSHSCNMTSTSTPQSDSRFLKFLISLCSDECFTINS
jgi:hypothetical protein